MRRHGWTHRQKETEMHRTEGPAQECAKADRIGAAHAKDRSAKSYVERTGAARPAHTVRRAIIMAAGKGERMHPLTLQTPKPLIRVNGRRIR